MPTRCVNFSRNTKLGYRHWFVAKFKTNFRPVERARHLTEKLARSGLVLAVTAKGESLRQAKTMADRIIETRAASVSGIKRTARLGGNPTRRD